ncbi:MAG: putative ATP-dependent zinc protease [Nitrososphaeraceae archaeon]
MNEKVIGNSVDVNFVSLGVVVNGKVDTGATTSSLHADQIKQHGNKVSFSCSEISNKIITMELSGTQEVVSADAGGNHRPVIEMDVEINGVLIKGASFNLNDRSEMDSPVLIGQNVLKAGHFIIDVNKDNQTESNPDNAGSNPDNAEASAKVLEAVQVLIENNVTISQLLRYMQTVVVTSKE